MKYFTFFTFEYTNVHIFSQKNIKNISYNKRVVKYMRTHKNTSQILQIVRFMRKLRIAAG